VRVALARRPKKKKKTAAAPKKTKENSRGFLENFALGRVVTAKALQKDRAARAKKVQGP
jgi:hypothetical protein